MRGESSPLFPLDPLCSLLLLQLDNQQMASVVAIRLIGLASPQSSMLRHARDLAGAGLPGIAVKHESYRRCRKTPNLRLPAMPGYGSNCLGRV